MLVYEPRRTAPLESVAARQSSDAIEMRVMVDGSVDASAASVCKATKGHSSALANEDGKSETEKEGAEAEEEEDDDEDEEKILGAWGGIVAMFIATVFIAILSEEIVDAVDGASRSLNIPGMKRIRPTACLIRGARLIALFRARVLPLRAHRVIHHFFQTYRGFCLFTRT